jgi:hypothetical protein
MTKDTMKEAGVAADLAFFDDWIDALEDRRDLSEITVPAGEMRLTQNS